MNNNEPITLGKVKKGASGKPIIVVIIFLFIGAIILFLPTIINYFGEYNIIDLVKNGQIIDFIANHDSYINKNNNVSTPETNKEEKIYINSKTVIKESDFTLSNFILTEDKISFKVNQEKSSNLDEQYYYLILKKDNEYLAYIRISNSISKENIIEYKFKNKLKSLLEIEGSIKKYNDNDYPEFTLSSDETGLASLNCNLDTDTYEYILENNKLIKIKQTLNYNDNGNNEDYLKEFEKYTTLTNKINTNNGSATITENYNGFIFTTDIDLKTYSEKINSNYYSLNTSSNKINFDMEAKGFDCK